MGSSVETQTYRKGHAHRPMESTKRYPSPRDDAGRGRKAFHGPDPLLQPPAIFGRPILELAVDAKIMGPVMGDVGIVLRLPADRDQIGVAFFEHRFGLLGFE